uniref:Diguanylate cyclase/phosphodiesterase n=1 Tax=uncultured Desulfobacterium sp. TaxID=201089 RepID=E1YK24_9BACT|nr:hypothetical protein N47_E51400 [uncultured Desulfobacterium sp.]
MGGTFLVNVINSRRFIEDQLASHAQDTATSLGLSLSTSNNKSNMATVNSMVDAIFDRGYYQKIIVLSMQGEILLERNMPIRIKNVPDWFIKLLPLSTPDREALVMSGWKQSGRVLVKSHPGYAYALLWHNFKDIFKWFVSMWLIGTILIILIMRVVLLNLKEVESQAVAVSNREFPEVKKLPWSRELRSVVTAMNHMTQKLKITFQDQARFIELLRKEAYNDPVTFLANRRHFLSRLSFLIESSDEFLMGSLVLIQINEFKKFNQLHGHEEGDRLLEKAARTIETECSKLGSNYLLGRMNGAEFALLLQNIEQAESEKIVKSVLVKLDQVNSLYNSPIVFHCGISSYTGSETINRLFAAADAALRITQGYSVSSLECFEKNSNISCNFSGANSLGNMLRDSLRDNKVKLHLEPIISCMGSELLHYEALARIRDENGQLLPAQIFIRLAEEMECIQDLDKLIITALLDCMKANTADTNHYAVNLSSISMKDSAFMDWLIQTLRKFPDHSKRLIFETTEYGCISFFESVKSSISRILSTGSQFGLDHFGIGSVSFGYLINLKLDYLKIDGTYIRDISKNMDNQFFIQGIGNIAHGLDIKIIGTCTEKEEDFITLKSLGADAAQGRLFS